MLSPKAQLNLKHAKSYFREHLSVGDYYSVEAQVRGEWFGQAADRLGLSGTVGEADFLALCEGRNPTTRVRLTQRLNSTRRESLGGELANRRVFYDFTISPPKSVSIVALSHDDRILALHDRAARTAMSELETFASTRVRKGGAQADRETGNVIGATFRHDTSRELDPHLHTHCVVFNATFDSAENRWKAIQVQGMYAAQKFAENLYYHELAKGLRELGYEIENNPRDFEIKGVPFERRSVVTDYELLAAALARGRGEAVDLAELRFAVAEGAYLREPGSRKLTSQAVLACEREIVQTAYAGRRQHEAINPTFEPARELSDEQATAVREILGSRDFITLFRGGAGTGKSFTLKEVERGLSLVGRPVVVLAPQRQQVEDLRRDGLPAETVARTVAQNALPRGAVVIVDEAGQLGGRELRDVIRLAKAHGARMILSGDTRQHGAVTASDALVAIEKHSGLRPVEIRRIRRQDPSRGRTKQERAQIRAYRAAVKTAASGRTLESFERLDAIGWIREFPPDDLHDALIAEYLAARGRKENVLVVAQTREEVRRVNDRIRRGLVLSGVLGEGRRVLAQEAMDWTEAQKRDARFYRPGQQVQFLKRYGRFRAGDSSEVVEANAEGLVLLKDGRRSAFSFRYANRIVVTGSVELELVPGDRIQLKFNGRSTEGRRINNGELATVVRVETDGRVVVQDDNHTRKTLAPTQRLFTRGYAVTSYASQGKTVDTVLLADAANRAATNQKQWYVTISRGRRRALIFTPDRDGLRANLTNPGERELALSLKVKGAVNWRRERMQATRQARAHQTLIQRQRSANPTQNRGIRV